MTIPRRAALTALLVALAADYTRAQGFTAGDPSPALPEADGHTLAGALEMTSVGAATGVLHAGLPIDIPSARGGPQPKLRLRYSSTAGVRDAGVGWGLELPVIERGPATTPVINGWTGRHEPGVFSMGGAPTYDDPPVEGTILNPGWTTSGSDIYKRRQVLAKMSRFTFSGESLVPVCEVESIVFPCPAAATDPLPEWVSKGWIYFRLERDMSYSRLFWSPDRQTWRVQIKGGDIFEFGTPLVQPQPRGDDTIDDDQYFGTLAGSTATYALTRHFRWNLARIFSPDSEGGEPRNVVVFLWAKLGDTGLGYLTDIYYTSPADWRSDRPPVDDYAHHVRLAWERRARILTSFAPIWRAVPDYVLARVDVASKTFRDGRAPRELVRRHYLTYTLQGTRSYLTGFQLEGRCATPVVESSGGGLPPTSCPRRPPVTLRYSQPESNTVASSVLFMDGPGGTPMPVPRHLTPLDINGDSLIDFVETDPDHSTFTGPRKEDRRLYIDNGTWHVATTIKATHNLLSKFGYSVTGDFSGTGESGVWWYVPPSPPSVGISPGLSLPRLKPDGWRWEHVLGGEIDAHAQHYLFRMKLVGDVNGDGLTDLVNYADAEYAGSGQAYVPPAKPYSKRPNWEQYSSLGAWLGYRFVYGGPTYGMPGYRSALSFDGTGTCIGPSHSDLDGSWPDGELSVHLADVNGDSLADIVAVGGNQVRYWPSTGRGQFTACRGVGCTCSTPTASAQPAYMLAADLGSDRSPKRIRLGDVNGDGYSDLISWDTTGVRISFNLDGWLFQPPIFVSGFWFSSRWADAVQNDTLDVWFADMNGNGLVDVVMSDREHVAWFDWHRLINIARAFAPRAWAPRPGLLIDMDNGLGARTSIAYQSTADLTSIGLNTGQPFPEPLPQVLPVVMRITSDSGVPGREPFGTLYEYEDPAWDGWERRLRGFRKVTITRSGQSAGVTTERFFFPSCPERFCGSADADFQRQQAAAGVPLVTETSDLAGRYLSTVAESYEVRDLVQGMDDRWVRSTAAYQVDTRLYDTTDWTASAATTEQRVRTAGRESRSLWTGRVPVRGAKSALIRTTFEHDAYGNLAKRIEHGRILENGGPIDDPIVTTVTANPPRPDWRFVPERMVVDAFPTRPGVPTDQRRLTLYEQDGAGRLAAISAALSGTLSLDRHHEDSTATIAPPPPGASFNTVVLLARYHYDGLDNVVRIERPAGCMGIVYDAEYAQLAVERQVFRTGCFADALSTRYEWDRGLESLLRIRDATGAGSQMSLDGFGRVVAIRLPDPATGSAELQPTVRAEYFDPVGGAPTRERMLARQSPGRDAVTWSYVDGRGQPFLTLTSADLSAGDGGAWLARGLPRVGDDGLVSGVFEPWFYNGDPAAHPLTPPTTPLSTLERDGFGRVVARKRADGTLIAKYAYRLLATEVEDAAGRWTRVEIDGHGRVELQRRKTASDEIRVSTTYQVLGEPSRIVQEMTAGSLTTLNAQIARWMQYDALGRMVVNAEPNTSAAFSSNPAAAGATKAWRYAYDFAGRIVGTSDARGCGVNYIYDRLGRTIAEDWSPCLRTHAPYTAPNLADGSGTEVFYRYDAPEPGQTTDFGVSAQNLIGRLVATRDRGTHSRVAYDARGRQIGIARRIARPSDDAAIWPESPMADRYADDWFRSTLEYDDAARLTRIATGAHAPELLDASGASHLTLAYSARGMLTAVSGAYGALLNGVTADAAGRPLSVKLGDLAATTTTFTYDTTPARRPAGVKVARTAPALWTAGGPGYTPPGAGDPPTTQQVLENLTFTFGAADTLSGIQDLRAATDWPTGAKPVSRTFQHDLLGRLTRVDYTYTGGPDRAVALGGDIPRSAAADRPVLQTFSFDRAGNVKETIDDAGAFFERSLGPIQFGTFVAGPNQVTGVGNGRLATHYDASGNLVDLTVRRPTCADAAGRCTHRFAYDWDEIGELSRARRWDYVIVPAGEPVYPALPATTPAADLRFRYDATGARVIRSQVQTDGSQRHAAWPLPTLRLDDAAYDATSTTYQRDASTEEVTLLGLGRAIHRAGLPGAADVHVLLDVRDHLGSTISVIDKATSELVERRSYLPYGGSESEYRPARWGGLSARARFTGKEDDGAVGLAYFGARYYHPALGRWISADPLSVHRLASDRNPYGYVAGDVVRATDAEGLQACIGAEQCGGDGGANGGYQDGGSHEGNFMGPGTARRGPPPPPIPDPVAPANSGVVPFDPGRNMGVLQRWIWGGSGTFHDIVTSDRFWRTQQYVYGAIAVTAAVIATGGLILEAGAAAEAGAGGGALFARAGPTIGAAVATAHQSGALNSVEQELIEEAEVVGPALEAEVEVLSSRLAQIAGQMHPAASQGGRTVGIMRPTGGVDLVASGARDLSPAVRNMLVNQETAVKLFGAHAEPTLLVAADRLQMIFPGSFLPRILVVTTNICPQCELLIRSSGGVLFGPRAVIWFW